MMVDAALGAFATTVENRNGAQNSVVLPRNKQVEAGFRYGSVWSTGTMAEKKRSG
jgi:hypothetical protein